MAGTTRRLVLGSTILAVVCATLFFAWRHLLDTHVTVIVSRDEGSVEIYLGLDAQAIPAIFAKTEDGWLNATGQIDFSSFREGTWEIGDHMLTRLDMRLGDTPSQFEAMSVMLHPKIDTMPFETVVDATLAISVCNVLSRDPATSLAGFDFYGGFIAFSPNFSKPLTIQFPQTGRLPVIARVIRYEDGRRLSRSWQVVADGGAVTLQ